MIFMVNENRIRNQQVTLVDVGGAGAVGYTSARINGEVMAVYSRGAGAAHTYFLELYPSGFLGDADFRIATLMATGNLYQNPAKLRFLDTGVQDTTGENPQTPAVIDDYVAVSGNTMGLGSTVIVNILYR